MLGVALLLCTRCGARETSLSWLTVPMETGESPTAITRRMPGSRAQVSGDVMLNCKCGTHVELVM